MSRLVIHLVGQPLDGGGLQMTSSSVTLGTDSAPVLYRGTVSSLEGTNLAATVRDANGHALALSMALQIDAESGTASGDVKARP